MYIPENMKIVIPARAGSKGWPFKNRKLMNYTFDLIQGNDVIVSSNDEVILKEAEKRKFITIERDEKLCQDTTSTKDVLLDVAEKIKLISEYNILLLYLTYPYRTNKLIYQATVEFNRTECKSLLCREPIATNSYLVIYYDYFNKQWRKVIDHDFYRRQDPPEYFEISHVVCIFNVEEIPKLNKNLYNKDTYFMLIERQKDIDYEGDLK